MEIWSDEINKFINSVSKRAEAAESEFYRGRCLSGEPSFMFKIYNDMVNDYLMQFGSLSNRGDLLSIGTRASLIRRGFWLDFHPKAIYKNGDLTGEKLVYLGDILEKKLVELDNKVHWFLVTKSFDSMRSSVNYPVYFQEFEREVYTSGNVTWIGNRCFDVKEEETNGLPLGFKNIERTKEFVELIWRGKENYIKLGI